MGVFNAVRDLQAGRFQAGVVHRIGLAEAGAVRLSLAADVPAGLRTRIDQAAAAIRDGRLHVPEQYDGAEFQTPA